MLVGSVILRVAAALTLMDMCTSQKLIEQPKKMRKPRKYPLQVHSMYQNQILKKPPKTVGEWSAWSSWSPCSRSCGGGITQQTRYCITRPADSRFMKGPRRRRQNDKSLNGCVGLYRRIHLCNRQDCPSGVDFRYEQCAAFNNRRFKGKIFYWEPFLKENDECVLNCRPVGMDFYATLNKSVIDGTPCNHPLTSTGRKAPKGTRGVCIDGSCKSVNSHGVIGSSDENQEECSACLKGSCRSINGLYTRPDLAPGYSLVAQIPQGACRILVQQLKHTRNLLALKNANGSFIVNGDWKFSNSREIEGAGAKFKYIKQDGNLLETISSPGPLANPVDIMIVNYQANPGIKYGYSIPVDPDQPIIAPPLIKKPTISDGIEPRRLDPPPFNSLHTQKDEAKPPQSHSSHHRRSRLRRRFVWKITGVTACSKPCGGGIQTSVVTCIREHTQSPVIDRRCAHLERPNTRPIRCNTFDCSPKWHGEWSDCSVSCGNGVQHYVVQCQQEMGNGKTSGVTEVSCPKPKPSSQTRSCNKAACENVSDNELAPQNGVTQASVLTKEWSVGPWSQCTVSCGTGHKSRSVICPSGQCHPEDRPRHAEYCDAGPCESKPTTTLQSSSSTFSYWFLTEWSHCSEACGTGTQTRLAVCSRDSCDSSSKPETSRACSSDKLCSGQWFTGPWGPCSDSCSGRAKQRREVFCIVKIRGQSHITNEMTCSKDLKPSEEQLCNGKCPPQWFLGEWSNCEGACPNGIQRREVRCMDADGKPSTGCVESDVPSAKRTCACARREEHRDRNRPAQDEPADRSCVDRIRNCHLAVQARLCQYPYYTNHCCMSCRRTQQDLLE